MEMDLQSTVILVLCLRDGSGGSFTSCSPGAPGLVDSFVSGWVGVWLTG